jgi:hypothetical protein
MNLEHRLDHAVNWPRAVQSSVAILGALTFGAMAYGYGYGVSGGRTESYPQGAAAAAAPLGVADYCLNEPPTLTQIVLRDFRGETGNPANWSGVWGNGSPGVDDGFSVEVDATSPLLGDSVGTMSFVIDSTADGTTPGSAIYAMGDSTANAGQDTLYMCTAIKYSSGFDYHASGVKLDFFASDSLTNPGSGRPVFLINNLRNGKRVMEIHIQGDTSAILNPTADTVDVADDTWYKLEVLLIGQNGGANAEGRLWLNGTKTVEYTGFRFSSKNTLRWGSDARIPLDGYKWEPTWGGNGDSLTANGQIYRAFIYLSGNN